MIGLCWLYGCFDCMVGMYDSFAVGLVDLVVHIHVCGRFVSEKVMEQNVDIVEKIME